MSILIDINHEAGDLSEYDSTVTDGGDLSVTAAAALGGTSYGLQCVIDDTVAIYGQKAISIPGRTLRYRFYIDPNDIYLPNNYGGHTIFRIHGGSPYILTYVSFARYDSFSSGYAVFANVYDDSNTRQNTGYQEIPNGPCYIEVLIEGASSATASDGRLAMWIDGTQVYDSGAVYDIYDVFDSKTAMQFGATESIDAGTSGTFYLDQLIINDDGMLIGPHQSSGQTYQLAALALAASGTPTASVLAVLRSFGGVAVGATTTPDVSTLAVLRAVSGAASSSSVTPDALALAVTRALAAAVLAGSISPDDAVLAIPQLLRPSADSYTGQWTTRAGGASNLYQTIDEAAPNDDDYMQSEAAPASSPVVVKLQAGQDPQVSADHRLHYRYQRLGETPTINLTVELRQGYASEASLGTLIGSWQHNAIGASVAQADQTLTAEQADSITSYGDLYLRFVAAGV
jgi:hypothetical protein